MRETELEVEHDWMITVSHKLGISLGARLIFEPHGNSARDITKLRSCGFQAAGLASTVRYELPPSRLHYQQQRLFRITPQPS